MWPNGEGADQISDYSLGAGSNPELSLTKQVKVVRCDIKESS
jgi:hypothetical protein